jgi:thioredoxin-dependent peroxiredoxin
MECESLRDSGEELQSYDVVYFAASVDDEETNRRFAESLDLNYPILSDPDKAVAAAYGVLHESGNFAQRWTFYIDKEGRIARIDKEVKPASSGEDMVRHLEELGFPRR